MVVREDERGEGERRDDKKRWWERVREDMMRERGCDRMREEAAS